MNQSQFSGGKRQSSTPIVSIITFAVLVALVSMLLFRNGQDDQPEVVVEPEVPAAADEPLFFYSQAYWCLALEGPKLGDDVEAICQIAKAGGCTIIDLVPPEHREAVLANGLRLGTDLPPLGADRDLPPFGESLAHADQARRAEILQFLQDHLRSLQTFNEGRPEEECIRSMIVFAGLAEPNGNPAPEQVLPVLAEGLAELSVTADECGIDLLLEPLNGAFTGDDWRSHPGYLLPSVDDCADVVRDARALAADRVSKPCLWLLPDFYHIGYEETTCVEAVERHWDMIGRIHVAGVYDPPLEGPVPTRSEPVYEGQRSDIAQAFERLLELQQEAGLAGQYTIVHEWIPFDTAEASIISNMDRTMALCEGAPFDVLPAPPAAAP